MKILVIQLARLGDIYSTWPILRALKRNYPQAQVDLLVRRRFVEATSGLESIRKLHILETDKMLLPFISGNANRVHEAIASWSEFVGGIRSEGYDQIINLSFSPLSSHLSFSLAQKNTIVKGFTRHSDGSFRLPDDWSAYFFAQVGIGSFNRIHVVDLFSLVSGVTLEDDDWRGPSTLRAESRKKRVIFHIGASLKNKTVHLESWTKIISGLVQLVDHDMVIVGSAEERKMAALVIDRLTQGHVQNLCGETSLSQLMELIQSSELVVGGDSSPMHMAGLTSTPCLNISFESVNFWETGPRSAGSRILLFKDQDALGTGASIESVVREAHLALRNLPSEKAIVISNGPCQLYEVNDNTENNFEWSLLLAIYFGEPFPVANSSTFLKGLVELRQIGDLAIEQLRRFQSDPTQRTPLEILARLDEMIGKIGELVPSLRVISSWIKAQKIMVAPGDLDVMIEENRQAYERLVRMVSQYIPREKMSTPSL
jgi:heptosyltransferase-3